MSDVARRAGVSVKTVSNVVNAFPHVRDSTRLRVEEAIAELGYEVNETARSLRKGRTGLIALAVPELSQPYFAQLADDILVAARACGLHVLIDPTGFSREAELAALDNPRRHVVDGLLFSPVALDPADAGLVEVDYPLVLLGEQLFSPAVDHVTMRNREGARAATELLLRHGRRRIAVLGAPHEGARGTSTLRYAGYVDALRDAGIEVDPRLVAWTDDGWHRPNGAVAISGVLGTGVRPDGVVAFNDALAVGAMHELQVRGLRVPDDVAVVGWDDTEDAGYTTPSLTSVDGGRAEIARVAVALLAQRIAGRGPAEPVLHHADLRVVERDSTPRG